MKAPSLRRRLLALVLSLVGAVWVATAVLTFFDVRHELDELLDGHLAQAAALLVVQQAAHFDDEDEEAPEAPLLHHYAPKVAFQVFHEGRLVRRSANAPPSPMVSIDQPLHEGFTQARLGGEPWRVFATRGAERDVQVFVGESLHSRGAILWAVLRGTLWPLAVGLPLLALAVGWAVHGGLRPLRRLGAELAARAPAALSPVTVAGTPAEMRPMLDALNGLFARIEALVEGERRFTADAAHELRTPIAAVRAQAQVALGAHDDAERGHALRSLIAGCDRATRLVEQLLVLARLESGPGAERRGCDVVAVARGLLAASAPAAAGRAQDVSLDAPATCRWPIDETLLTVLLRNLLDNALRYSPDGAALRVSVGGDGTLAVEDSGPGMDAETIARLGQRFFRGDPAGAPGSGLGWSIVRRIAERERLTLSVDRSPALGGLRVRLRPAQNS